MIHIEPLGDRVVLQRIEPNIEFATFTSTSGKDKGKKTTLVIPEIAQRPIMEGIVLAVGPEVMALQKSDQVLFSQFAGVEIEDGGRKLMVLKENEIIGLVWHDGQRAGKCQN